MPAKLVEVAGGAKHGRTPEAHGLQAWVDYDNSYILSMIAYLELR